jgi:hypothetical protein
LLRAIIQTSKSLKFKELGSWVNQGLNAVTNKHSASLHVTLNRGRVASLMVEKKKERTYHTSFTVLTRSRMRWDWAIWCSAFLADSGVGGFNSGWKTRDNVQPELVDG